MIETVLRRNLLAAASLALPDVRLFVRNVGFFKLASGHAFRAGLPGQADVWGFTRDGRAMEIELKRKSKLSPEQIRWRDFCLAWNVIWLLLEEKNESNPVPRWIDEIHAATHG